MTSKDDVRFAELGQWFVAADRGGRKGIFAEQVFKFNVNTGMVFVPENEETVDEIIV